MLCILFIIITASSEYETNSANIVVGSLFDLYQNIFSSSQGDVCNFSPSCSRFGRQAVAEHGIVLGTLMATDRLTRCNPWAYLYYGTYYEGIRDGKLYDPIEKRGQAAFSDQQSQPAEISFPQLPAPPDDDSLYQPHNILKFADFLYQRAEYPAALNEYRRYEFLVGSISDTVRQRIITCLIESERYREAMISADGIVDLSQRTFIKGSIMYAAAQYDSSRYYLQQSVSHKQDVQKLTGLGYAREFNFRDAGKYITLPPGMPRKKKAALGAVCALFPGGGHVYGGRAGDGIFSFLMIGTGAMLSYYYYNQDEDLKFSLAFATTAVFYAANIYGGINAVRDYNHHQNKRYLERIIEAN
ncbi:MAG: membrane protein insertion efficiency factor YidD [candidate division WOR-3 bacterium]|nr:MAG: membrane protein insertion efficiency factor YidD [candidate division WOR-3 bacterium]